MSRQSRYLQHACEVSRAVEQQNVPVTPSHVLPSKKSEGVVQSHCMETRFLGFGTEIDDEKRMILIPNTWQTYVLSSVLCICFFRHVFVPLNQALGMIFMEAKLSIPTDPRQMRHVKPSLIFGPFSHLNSPTKLSSTRIARHPSIYQSAANRPNTTVRVNIKYYMTTLRS